MRVMSVMKTDKYEVIYGGYCDEVTEVVEADDVISQDDLMRFYKNDELVFAISTKRLIRLKRIEESKDENESSK